jgi:hypothetical protein
MPRVSFKPIVAAAVLLAITNGVATAQTSRGPIVDGHQPQPTQAQLESTHDVQWNRWNNRVQPDIDRLYDEIMRATTQP